MCEIYIVDSIYVYSFMDIGFRHQICLLYRKITSNIEIIRGIHKYYFSSISHTFNHVSILEMSKLENTYSRVIAPLEKNWIKRTLADYWKKTLTIERTHMFLKVYAHYWIFLNNLKNACTLWWQFFFKIYILLFN